MMKHRISNYCFVPTDKCNHRFKEKIFADSLTCEVICDAVVNWPVNLREMPEKIPFRSHLMMDPFNILMLETKNDLEIKTIVS